jgi:TRAP-type mannitol/chloroaromatic compound transport system permease small subunit
MKAGRGDTEMWLHSLTSARVFSWDSFMMDNVFFIAVTYAVTFASHFRLGTFYWKLSRFVSGTVAENRDIIISHHFFFPPRKSGFFRQS